MGDGEASLPGRLPGPDADTFLRLKVEAVDTRLQRSDPVEARVVLVTLGDIRAGVDPVLPGAVGVSRLGPLQVGPRLTLVLGVVDVVARVFSLGPLLVKDEAVRAEPSLGPLVDTLEVTVALGGVGVQPVLAPRADELYLGLSPWEGSKGHSHCHCYQQPHRHTTATLRP